MKFISLQFLHTKQFSQSKWKLGLSRFSVEIKESKKLRMEFSKQNKLPFEPVIKSNILFDQQRQGQMHLQVHVSAR